MAKSESPTLFCTIAGPDKPFLFASGEIIPTATLAYKTFGKLNRDGSNAVLLFPVLTMSQHAAGHDADGPGTHLWTEECRAGWWDEFIGPGRAVDTDQFFVICTNFLGGCYGSTGPGSLDPYTGKRYGSAFPRLDVKDIVNAQMRLIRELGIERLHSVIGASFGGYLAYDLARRYPHSVDRVISIASGCRVTTEMAHSNHMQIKSIEYDSCIDQGHGADFQPCRGLQLARMIALKSYVNLEDLERALREKCRSSCGCADDQSFIDRIGGFFAEHARIFSKRFDPHTYLRLLGAWQSFDPGFDYHRSQPGSEWESGATAALTPCRHQPWTVISIDSDRCFPSEEQRFLVAALNAAGIECSLTEVSSRKGHDSILREPELYAETIRIALARGWNMDANAARPPSRPMYYSTKRDHDLAQNRVSSTS